MKCSLHVANFLEEISSLSHPLVSLYSLHSSLKKAFLSLLAILWNSAFKWVYLSFSLLLFASLLFTAICKASSTSPNNWMSLLASDLTSWLMILSFIPWLVNSSLWGGEGHKETLPVPTLWILVDSGEEEKVALGPFVVTKTVNHKKDP